MEKRRDQDVLSLENKENATLHFGWEVEIFPRYTLGQLFQWLKVPKDMVLLMHNRLYLHYKETHIIYLT